MFLKLSYVVFLLTLLSCSAKKNEIHLNTAQNKKVTVNFIPNLKKCLPEDTIITSKSFVKYILQDTSFDVKVQINNKDTLLGFGFACDAPPGLIPEIYGANKNTICLFHGYGQNFREFIICHLNGNLIDINRYEIALAFDEINNNVAFRNYDSPGIIYVKNIVTNKIKKFVLPPDLSYDWISSATLCKQWLFLKFQNQKHLRFLISRN
jgi:hypothetical protein